MERVKRLGGNLYQFRPALSDVSAERFAEMAFESGVQAETEAIKDGTNDFGKALRFYSKSVSYGTNVSAKALLHIGSIKFKLNEFEKALKVFNRAIKLDLNFAKVHYSKGLCLEKLNRETEAIDSYLVAIRINSLCFEAYYNLGFIYYGRGECHLAVSYLKKACGCNDVDKRSRDHIENAIRKMEESGRVDGSGRTLVLVKSKQVEMFPSDVEF
jgi:tetratricopeptide (TPR) repeat protein